MTRSWKQAKRSVSEVYNVAKQRASLSGRRRALLRELLRVDSAVASHDTRNTHPSHADSTKVEPAVSLSFTDGTSLLSTTSTELHDLSTETSTSGPDFDPTVGHIHDQEQAVKADDNDHDDEEQEAEEKEKEREAEHHEQKSPDESIPGCVAIDEDTSPVEDTPPIVTVDRNDLEVDSIPRPRKRISSSTCASIRSGLSLRIVSTNASSNTPSSNSSTTSDVFLEVEKDSNSQNAEGKTQLALAQSRMHRWVQKAFGKATNIASPVPQGLSQDQKLSLFAPNRSPETGKLPDDEIWGSIRAIPEAAFVDLAMQHAPFYAKSARFLEFKEGENNRVAILEYDTGTKVCARVPACGWGDKWKDIDKIGMRNTALTMRYLRTHTTMPVPEIAVYDTSFENVLGAPFMLMSCMEGSAVRKTWWDDLYTPSKKHPDDPFWTIPFETVSPKLEQKRLNTLKSLASFTSQLAKFKYTSKGVLKFPADDDTNPVVEYGTTVSYGQTKRDQDFDACVKAWSEAPQQSSNQILVDALSKWDTRHLIDISSRHLNGDLDTTRADAVKRHHGVHTLWRCLIQAMPFSDFTTGPGSAPEHFVISMPDTNLDNIIVDDNGFVVGLIDWDRIQTMPSYIGWSTVPNWLFGDEGEYHEWPSFQSTSDKDQYYRLKYAQYLRDHCGSDTEDWKFTPASHLMWHIFTKIGDSEEMEVIMDKLLAIILPDTNQDHVYLKCNQLSLAARAFFRQKFADILGTTIYDADTLRYNICEPPSLLGRAMHQIPTDDPPINDDGYESDPDSSDAESYFWYVAEQKQKDEDRGRVSRFLNRVKNCYWGIKNRGIYMGYRCGKMMKRGAEVLKRQDVVMEDQDVEAEV